MPVKILVRRTRWGPVFLCPGKDKVGKAAFITFLTNITPDCDCCSFSDAPIVGDSGILASLDPIALDQACVDLVNAEPGISASRLAGNEDNPDKFRALFHHIDWTRQLAYGEQLGFGTRDYRLVKLR
ncbi:Ferredoxin [Candidatus Desulforudis audaxviator]|nr:Ferredoxin [Candidatus Desulforudis audaxviator]